MMRARLRDRNMSSRSNAKSLDAPVAPKATSLRDACISSLSPFTPKARACVQLNYSDLIGTSHSRHGPSAAAVRRNSVGMTIATAAWRGRHVVRCSLDRLSRLQGVEECSINFGFQGKYPGLGPPMYALTLAADAITIAKGQL